MYARKIRVGQGSSFLLKQKKREKRKAAQAQFYIVILLTFQGDDKGFQDRPTCFDRYQQLLLQLFQHESMVCHR